MCCFCPNLTSIYFFTSYEVMFKNYVNCCTLKDEILTSIIVFFSGYTLPRRVKSPPTWYIFYVRHYTHSLLSHTYCHCYCMWINDLKHDWILRRYLSDIDFAGGKLWNNNGVAFWEINHLEVIYHSRRSNINICPAKTALTLYRHFYTRRSTWCVY